MTYSGNSPVSIFLGLREHRPTIIGSMVYMAHAVVWVCWSGVQTRSCGKLNILIAIHANASFKLRIPGKLFQK